MRDNGYYWVKYFSGCKSGKEFEIAKIDEDYVHFMGTEEGDFLSNLEQHAEWGPRIEQYRTWP